MEPSVCLHRRSNSVVICEDPRERKGKEFVNNEFIGKIAINVSDIPTQVPLDSPLAPEWYKLEDKDMDKANLSVGELMLVIWFGTQADEVFIDAWHSYVATVTGLLRTRVSADKSLNPRWNEDLMFVAAEPFYDYLVLTVVGGDVVQELKFASKLNVRISLDGGYHVFDGSLIAAAITERHLTGCGHQHLVCRSWEL
ncbi:hypothetical protein Goshw_030371 [Gossypium schwendimanii]|uniref:C2 domain-containing protein n=1 Tax=Gossypium schwendimanii TaxID=34291 RepID=A0A7J9NDY6_GOSSC|nr:hypothetical protein [Gossypium schwendimanii]